MNKQEKEIRQRLKADFLYYAEKCLNIRTKKGAIINFKLNSAQLFIHEAIEKQLKEAGRVRALVLKGRQQGCSTYVEGRFFWKVSHNRGVRAFILTHLEEATKNLFQIMKRFFDSCPAMVKPSASHMNSKELVFNILDSGYQVGTARSQGVGRSNTLQYFHGSEVAYWVNAEEHVSGVLQAVADAEGTEVILESTSAGAGGLFYALCMEAHKGRSEYQLIFVPWFWQSEYRKQLPYDFTLTKEEEDYKCEHKLDNEQIAWRRQKIYQLGNIWTFRREYPATVEEAFNADVSGALWTREVLQKNRVHKGDLPQLARIIVAVDPAVTANKNSDETGIVVAGLGVDNHAYILDDLSGKYTPSEWACAVINAYYDYKADRVVAEVNQGGDLVEHTIRSFDANISYKAVHASRGKVTRAEPIAALDSQGRIHHAGIFAALEDQMCRFNPSVNFTSSPDRVDARIWACTELLLEKNKKIEGPKIWKG